MKFIFCTPTQTHLTPLHSLKFLSENEFLSLARSSLSYAVATPHHCAVRRRRRRPRRSQVTPRDCSASCFFPVSSVTAPSLSHDSLCNCAHVLFRLRPPRHAAAGFLLLLEENFLQHVHSLIQNSDSDFWRNGRFLVHSSSQLASHKDSGWLASFDERKLWGWLLVSIGSVFFVGYFFVALISKLLPPSHIPLISALQNDWGENCSFFGTCEKGEKKIKANRRPYQSYQQMPIKLGKPHNQSLCSF